MLWFSLFLGIANIFFSIYFCTMILMRLNKRLFIQICVFHSCLLSSAQTKISGTVVDKETQEPLVGAVVRVADKKSTGVTADANGVFTLDAPEGSDIVITYLGYATLRMKLMPNHTYQLSPSIKELQNVVVTATESSSLTSASVIGKHAMEHLQPSSFTDILELLPGGMARDPSLSTPNTINLREVPVSNGDYTTSSLGTAFVVDGAKVSTNANMQYLAGAYDNTATSRDFTNAGVDMRSISTDDIESVNVVRGIPSVEYGDLTSGLVKITRKKGGNNLSARFKADMDSKLFYLGKGFEWKPRRLSLNISADYLDNKADPRNVLETYSRITLSSRLSKQWQLSKHTAELNVNVDYSGSFDKDKVDPELNYGGVDRYKSEYNHLATNLSFALRSISSTSVFRDFNADVSVSADYDKATRTRLVQLDGETAAATTTTSGEHDAVIISPYTYTATQSVEGIPVSLYAKANALLALPRLHPASMSLKVGADWQLDKNYGDGQVFDPYHPVYPGVSARPRKYSSIPASSIVGGYAEANAGVPFGAFRLDLQAGLRATTCLNLPSSYYLNSKVYLDPRANVGLTLPTVALGGHELIVQLRGGWGMHTKMPTIDQLFPDKAYMDIVELNYFNERKDLRRIFLRTYVIDPVNEALKAARNRKWEVSIDTRWYGNRLTLTYFNEDMKSGFRSSALYSPYYYRRFDTSGLDASALVAPPDVTTLPYTEYNELLAHYVTTNGSRTYKQGVELTMTTRRLPVINTRLTVTGAYFKTEYHNSLNVMERPSRVVSGQQVNIVGIYRDDDGYLREMYNTNFTFDTDLPKLALGFSLSAQCLWLTAKTSMAKDNHPVQYMTSDGVTHDFTSEDANDALLQFLVRTNNASLYERQTVPFSMNLNLKVTKRLIDDHLLVALFVNKLWDAHPDYVRNNFKIRRYVTPYFGLEINIKI